jgi:hypothetical protein
MDAAVLGLVESGEGDQIGGFWLGAAFLTIAGVLTAIAIAYFTKEARYSLGTGPQMIEAYISFVGIPVLLGGHCWLASMAAVAALPKHHDPVDGIGNEPGTKQMLNFPPEPIRLMTLQVHITNGEVDRNVSSTALQRSTRGLLPIRHGTRHGRRSQRVWWS